MTESTSVAAPKSKDWWEGRYQIDPDSDCWVWTGATCKGGYPVRSIKGRSSTGAHRQIMEDLGYRTLGLHVHHDCRNRLCINPRHLQVLTPHAHSQLHANDSKTGHDVGPQLPKNMTKAYLLARQAISDYLMSLPEDSLVIPKTPKCRQQVATAKALRLTTIAKATGVSSYLVAQVVKDLRLYQELLRKVSIAD